MIWTVLQLEIAMFVLRLSFNTGLHIEYNYLDVSRGDEARKLAERAMLGEELFKVVGDDGREGCFRGSALIGAQLVDVQQEVLSILDLNMLLDDSKASWCRLHHIPIPASLPQEVSGGPVGRG